MREEVEELKKELNEVKEQSLAMSILHDYKVTKIALISVIILLIIALAVQSIVFAIIINGKNSNKDYETGWEEVEETREQIIEDSNDISNSSIINGDAYGENYSKKNN